jgi:hypothetical protein
MVSVFTSSVVDCGLISTFIGGVMVSVFTWSVVDCGLISTVHRWCNG